MTQKPILISQEHQKAVTKYLKLCEQDGVPPLPLLNKLEIDNKHKVLSLEDYTISEGQIKCLSRCIDRFGKDAFNKLYVNNNGLTD